MGGPPAALDFAPNVADGVADAAENAACAEPAPSLSPACAGLRHPRSRCRGLRRSTPAHGYGVVTWPRRWKPLSAQHAARSAPEVFFYGHGAVSWPRRWTPLSAQHAAKEAQCEMLLASVEFTGETSCGRGHARRQVRFLSGRENIFATPTEEKKKFRARPP